MDASAKGGAKDRGAPRAAGRGRDPRWAVKPVSRGLGQPVRARRGAPRVTQLAAPLALASALLLTALPGGRCYAEEPAVRDVSEMSARSARRGGPARPRVGLSLPTQREERWVRDREAMELEARRLGVELRVRVSDNDEAKQAAQCRALFDEGIAVLVLAPHDASASAAIVDEARRRGVQVVSYDRLVTGSPHRYVYVSFDAVAVGALQAEYLTTRLPRGRYLLLAGPPSDHNARGYREGARGVLAPLLSSGAVRVVADETVPDWRPSEAERLTAAALEATGGAVDAVLAPNDATAGGVIAALTAAGRAGKVLVTGQDADLAAAIRIVRGTQAMTVFKDTRLLARKALEVARLLAQGRRADTHGRTVHNGRRDIPALLLTPFAVDRGNLDAMLIDSGYLERGLVYR